MMGRARLSSPCFVLKGLAEDQVFRDMVEEHQEVQNLMVVEVGTHLGGVSL